MSAERKNIYAPNPATERGKPFVFGADPKGEKFLYCCGSSVVIRNLANPLEADLYYEHSHSTTVAKYSPSGFYIASGDSSGELRIWDTVNAEHILKIELRVLSGPILDIAWSADSQRLIIVGEGRERFGAAILWDSGSSVGEISGHSKSIMSCDFKPTRPFRVITGSEDFACSWFEGPPFKFKHAMKDHTRFVNCVRFSPNGEKAVSVGSDKLGFFYDGKTGDQVNALEVANKGAIWSTCWSPDSSKIVTGSADKTCRVFDAEGKLQKSYELGNDTNDQQLGVLWQGDQIISVNLHGDISYLDSDSEGVQKVVYGHNKFVVALAYDNGSNSLFSASYDGFIIKRDLDSGATETIKGQGHTNTILRMHVQNNTLVTLSLDDSVRFTPIGGEYGPSVGTNAAPTDMAVGLKSDVVVITTIASIIVLRGGNVVNTTNVDYEPQAVAISPDETEVAVGGKNNSLHIFSLDGDVLKEEKTLAAHRGALSALEYSPNGQYLASADKNRDVFIWENHAKIIDGWCFHNAAISSLSWSSDSTHVASGALDSAFFVWDVQNKGKRINVQNAHPGGINSVLFVSGNTLVTCGDDCSIKSWTVNFH